MKLNRRQFLSNAATTAAATTIAVGAMAHHASAADKPANPLDPFQLVPLNKSGLKVSLIGAGTGMRGGNRASNMTRLGKEKFEALLRYEFEKGCRFFDMADMYGSHQFLASAFKAVPRDQYVISTKIWNRPGALPEKERPDANIVVDRFRKELDTDYIDMVLIHCMTDPQWCDQQKRQMDILANLKAKKIIRAHGVSVHSLTALEACATSPWVDSVHARINPYGDSMDDKNPDKVVAVLKKIHAAGKGVVGMKIVGEGRYRDDPDKRDKSIEYFMNLGCVDAVVVGFEKTTEVDDFAMRVGKVLASRKA